MGIGSFPLAMRVKAADRRAPAEPISTEGLREIITAATVDPRLERRRLERAINLARWGAGALALVVGPHLPNLGVTYVIGLGILALAYGTVFRIVADRMTSVRGAEWLARVSFAFDCLVVNLAMLVFAPDPHWMTFIYGALLIIVGAFRFGPPGAAFSTAVLTVGYLAVSAFRASAYDIPIAPERAATHVGFFVLVAVLMSAILRELHALRARHFGFYEPLLAAQSDLGELIVIADDRRPLYWNDAVVRTTGMTREALAQLSSVSELLAPEERQRHAERVRARLAAGFGDTFEADLLRADGSRVPVEVAVEPFLAGDQTWTIAIARDISLRRQAQQALEHQAVHDPLTGLANRTLLADRLDRAVAAGRRGGVPVSLLVLDLDRFKEVNDTFGHHFGDDLLRELARRLRTLVREADTVARLGGDEFAVVLPDADQRGAEEVAGSILRALHQPFVVAGQSLEVGASIGISVFPALADGAEALMRQADVAMYVAKRTSAGHAIYRPSDDQAAGHELALVARLREAIERDELLVHYHPLVRFGGDVVGMEALVRWDHPERGLVTPLAFVRLAEQSGLIRPLFRSVLQMALRDLARWREDGRPLTVSVNLSTRNLQDPRLADTVAEALAAARVPPDALILEITEDQIMADPMSAIAILAGLRATGVRISLDDFGTGYSSLAYLHRLPVDQLKIDRSFTTGLLADAGSAAIVRSVLDLGHNFGLEVVAEGIEDDPTWTELGDLGCDIAQGHLIARPMTAAATTQWLARARDQWHRSGSAPALRSGLRLRTRDVACDRSGDSAAVRQLAG